MSLAKVYEKAPHLSNWTLPKWVSLALEEVGQDEIAGAKSNPRILEYRRMAGLTQFGSMDDGQVPWCAIFVNAMLAGAGVKTSGSAMARSFAKHPDFVRIEKPMVGAVTVIGSSRGPASGHVFFYTAENGLMFQALGGNQNDSVSISMFQKAKLVGHFWPKAVPRLAAPFDQPVRLARPLLPHEKKAARDA